MKFRHILGEFAYMQCLLFQDFQNARCVGLDNMFAIIELNCHLYHPTISTPTFTVCLLIHRRTGTLKSHLLKVPKNPPHHLTAMTDCLGVHFWTTNRQIGLNAWQRGCHPSPSRGRRLARNSSQNFDHFEIPHRLPPTSLLDPGI